MMTKNSRWLLLTLLMAATGLSSADLPPIIAPEVDLERFSGKWFVVASTPVVIDKNAFNAIEEYAKPVGNRIATKFSFNNGAPDGTLKTYTPTAYVSKDSNAVWGMQFIWPFRAEYRIAYIDDDYSETIVARSKRDFVWVMTRDPFLPQARLQALNDKVIALGYDRSKLRFIPHDKTS